MLQAIGELEPRFRKSGQQQLLTETLLVRFALLDRSIELAEVLRRCKGKVVLSGYPSDLYGGLYKGWRTVDFDIANHAAGGRSKARKQEMLWMNW